MDSSYFYTNGCFGSERQVYAPLWGCGRIGTANTRFTSNLIIIYGCSLFLYQRRLRVRSASIRSPSGVWKKRKIPHQIYIRPHNNLWKQFIFVSTLAPGLIDMYIIFFRATEEYYKSCWPLGACGSVVSTNFILFLGGAARTPPRQPAIQWEKNPFSGKKNPFRGKQNPFSGEKNPFSGKKNPIQWKKKPFQWEKKPGRQSVGKKT